MGPVFSCGHMEQLAALTVVGKHGGMDVKRNERPEKGFL